MSGEDAKGLTSGEPGRDQFERFVDLYNAIDAHFRLALNAGPQNPRPGFRRLLVDYKRLHPWWQDDSALHLLADLRNVIIHSAGEPLFFPSPAAVAQLEEIVTRLRHPRCIADTHCLCDVLALTYAHTLADALALIRVNSFSQLPVYESSVFQGLITENGIARWLAYHNSEWGAPADFAGVPLGGLLALQERYATDAEREWPNVEFAAPNTSIDHVVFRFSENPALEAVLVTPNGTPAETPCGIVTRWDVLHLSPSGRNYSAA